MECIEQSNQKKVRLPTTDGKLSNGKVVGQEGVSFRISFITEGVHLL